MSAEQGVSARDLGIEGITNAVPVGQGSYGAVFRAEQSAYRRTVAVKVLSTPLLDPTDRKAFDRECQALGSLSGHPNIVTLHSAGITTGGNPYLIMDYLVGGSLSKRLETNGRYGWAEATSIGVKLAGALAVAHESGILHRDIKPDNVLISQYGEPQLADFGVARIQGGTSSTSTGSITGSLVHASPEVISGVAASPAADIWSLASTIATLLIGEPPFHRDGDETLHPLITRILTAPPRDMRPMGVPEEVCVAIEKGLAKDSWERPESAAAFGQLLQAAEQGLGVEPTRMAAPTAVVTEANADAPVTEFEPAPVAPSAMSPPSSDVAAPIPEVEQEEARTRTRASLGDVAPAAVAAAAATPPPAPPEAEAPGADGPPVEADAPEPVEVVDVVKADEVDEVAQEVAAEQAVEVEEEEFRYKAEPAVPPPPPPPEPAPQRDVITPEPEQKTDGAGNGRRIAVVAGLAVVAVIAVVIVVSRGGSSGTATSSTESSTTPQTPTVAAYAPPSNGAVWVPRLTGEVAEFDAVAGTLRRAVPLPGAAVHSLKIVELEGSVVTLDRTTGQLWLIPPQGEPTSVPFRGGDAKTVILLPAAPNVFISVNNRLGQVVAIDGATGNPIGGVAQLGGNSTKPVADGAGRIWVAVEDTGELVQIGVDPASGAAAVGQRVRLFEPGHALRSGVVDGTLVVIDITAGTAIVDPPANTQSIPFPLPDKPRGVNASQEANVGALPLTVNSSSQLLVLVNGVVTAYDHGAGDDKLGSAGAFAQEVFLPDSSNGLVLTFDFSGVPGEPVTLCPDAPQACLPGLQVQEGRLWIQSASTGAVTAVNPDGTMQVVQEPGTATISTQSTESEADG